MFILQKEKLKFEVNIQLSRETLCLECTSSMFVKSNYPKQHRSPRLTNLLHCLATLSSSFEQFSQTELQHIGQGILVPPSILLYEKYSKQIFSLFFFCFLVSIFKFLPMKKYLNFSKMTILIHISTCHTRQCNCTSNLTVQNISREKEKKLGCENS